MIDIIVHSHYNSTILRDQYAILSRSYIESEVEVVEENYFRSPNRNTCAFNTKI